MNNLKCVHSYNGLRVANNGTVMPCCYYDEESPLKDLNGNIIKTHTHSIKEMMESPDRISLIKDLESGIKHGACKRCWTDETNKNTSKRIEDNERFDTDYNKSLKYIELNLGNTCNLACRMCNIGASIKWYDDHLEIYDDEGGFRKDKDGYKKFVKQFYKSFEDDSRFWEEFEKILPQISAFDIYGGEPMLMKKQWEALEKSVELGYSKDQELHLATNGTIFAEKYFEILNKFKKCVVTFSLDAVGDRLEYIRHHAKWNNIETNVDKWINHPKNKNIEFDVAITVTNLNIYYLDEIVDWCISKNLTPFLIDVSRPEFYASYNLPQSAKNLINKKFDIYLYKQELPSFILESIKGSLNNMNSKEYDMDLWFMFKKKNGILDSNRKQSFTNTFQELNSVI
jgi:MoaA/NifB/PqqE/SkfB family radical SAM enzyme